MFSELPEMIVCVESGTVSKEQREMHVGRGETETVPRRKEKPHQKRTLQARSVSAFVEHM